MADEGTIRASEPEPLVPLIAEEFADPSGSPARPWTIGLLVGGAAGILFGAIAWATSIFEISGSPTLAIGFAYIIPGLGLSFVVSGLVLARRRVRVLRRIERLYALFAIAAVIAPVLVGLLESIRIEGWFEIVVTLAVVIIAVPSWFAATFCGVALTVCLVDANRRARAERASSTAP